MLNAVAVCSRHASILGKRLNSASQSWCQAMRQKTLTLLSSIQLLLLVFGPASLANDTSAELSVGGLVFTHSPDVSLESENLKISPKVISVRYQFVNQTAQPVTLTVAFPLPDIDLSEGENYSIPDNDPNNFLGFKTRVDGRPINFSVHQNAFLGAKNISAALRDAGVPLMPIGLEQIRLADLPQSTRDQLIQQGLLLKNGADDQGRQLYEGAWTVKTAAVRQQTFAPGRTVTVEHRYHPSVGMSFDTVLRKGLRLNKAMAAEVARYRKEYCIGEDFLAMLDKLAGEGEVNSANIQERRIKYALKSGANWAGPIKDFKLTIDKEKADRLISFCANEARPVSPTLIELTSKDFTPDKDLKILIVGRFDSKPLPDLRTGSTASKAQEPHRTQKPTEPHSTQRPTE
jgi:hypothetical protein